nr:hypothetical protein [Pandoravirus massiliensis]
MAVAVATPRGRQAKKNRPFAAMPLPVAPILADANIKKNEIPFLLVHGGLGRRAPGGATRPAVFSSSLFSRAGWPWGRFVLPFFSVCLRKKEHALLFPCRSLSLCPLSCCGNPRNEKKGRPSGRKNARRQPPWGLKGQCSLCRKIVSVARWLVVDTTGLSAIHSPRPERHPQRKKACTNPNTFSIAFFLAGRLRSKQRRAKGLCRSGFDLVFLMKPRKKK